MFWFSFCSFSDQGFFSCLSSSQHLVWKPQSGLLGTPVCLTSEHKAGYIGPCSLRCGHEVWVDVTWVTGVGNTGLVSDSSKDRVMGREMSSWSCCQTMCKGSMRTWLSCQLSMAVCTSNSKVRRSHGAQTHLVCPAQAFYCSYKISQSWTLGTVVVIANFLLPFLILPNAVCCVEKSKFVDRERPSCSRGLIMSSCLWSSRAGLALSPFWVFLTQHRVSIT